MQVVSSHQRKLQPNRDRLIEAVRASFIGRQQEFDPTGQDKRYVFDQKELLNDQQQFKLSKNFVPNNITKPQVLQGILQKQSPSMLVFWWQNRFCELRKHTFTYHETEDPQSKVAGTINFNAVTVDLIVSYGPNQQILSFKQKEFQ